MTNNIKKIEDWFALLNKKGLLCENYNSKIMSAHSKKQLMDIGSAFTLTALRIRTEIQ